MCRLLARSAKPLSPTPRDSVFGAAEVVRLEFPRLLGTVREGLGGARYRRLTTHSQPIAAVS